MNYLTRFREEYQRVSQDPYPVEGGQLIGPTVIFGGVSALYPFPLAVILNSCIASPSVAGNLFEEDPARLSALRVSSGIGIASGCIGKKMAAVSVPLLCPTACPQVAACCFSGCVGVSALHAAEASGCIKSVYILERL
jgi:hypothetical protein